MRRTERLFRIIQILRRARGPVVGQALAEELEVSLRTIYRDMSELLAQHVPVRGEAGIGYVLDEGYDLPPLMFNADELEAAMLGAAWVAWRGDDALARGAQDLIAKITAVVPEEMRVVLLDKRLRPVSFRPALPERIDRALIRRALRERRKLRMSYRDQDGIGTERVIWPVFLGFMEEVCILVAWCEMRGDFRHFRTDRIKDIGLLAARVPKPRKHLLALWKETLPQRTHTGCVSRPSSAH